MLKQEVESAQRAVRTDAYQMSIGEVVSMYREGDLVINPNFQRLFSWNDSQKSKLIESLLLGIPIPSIFVFETEDARWELIDGLQRISTVLEFMGILKDTKAGTEYPPSVLEATKYLPSLHNVVWEKSDRVTDVPLEEQVELDKSYQLTIRRARIGVEILKRPSDNNTKYDLFQRLNAGGTQANAQELRNCIVIMVNEAYFNFMQNLAEIDDFRTVVAATEDQIERQRHMEYAARFLVHNYVEYDGRLDVEEYIDNGILKLAVANEQVEARYRFSETFKLLRGVFGGNALRRITAGTHSGRVTLVAFESIAVGIGKNINEILALPDPQEFVRGKVSDFWREPVANLSQGMRGTTRIQKTITFGNEWFNP
ncbi:DUF262 domain-containing protein [Roseomonas chloroacetimidivorans]|uniref:DUF262 domain-containing protein n=1 Tax=Roseomonas chloroacetimidivorans TaxID=1766656 RepID=UPI003C7584E1